MSKDLERRISKLEIVANGASADDRYREPTIAEHHDACRLKDRYHQLTKFREFLSQFEWCSPFPPHTPEELAFIVECEGGALVRAASCLRSIRPGS